MTISKNVIIGVLIFIGLGYGAYKYGQTLDGGGAVRGASNVPSTEEFNIVMQNGRYSPSEVTVRQGNTVVLNITNQDSVAHAFGLPQFGGVVPGGHLIPRQTTRVQFTAGQVSRSDAALCGGPNPEDKGGGHTEEFILNVI